MAPRSRSPSPVARPCAGGEAAAESASRLPREDSPAHEGSPVDAGGADARSTTSSEQLRAVALFDDTPASQPFGSEGSGGAAGKGGAPRRRRIRRVLLEALLWLGAALFIVVGVGLQLLRDEEHAFRWLYFLASMPFLWSLVSFVVRRIYIRIEMIYFQELIYYWSSLRFSSSLLAFMLLALPTYQTFFVWAFCEKRACSNPTYVKAALITWRVLLCALIFALANFLKSLAAKLISQHFYATAHIAKVKQALEQEYYLLSLSKPRPEAPQPVLPSLAKMSTGLGRMSARHLAARAATSAAPAPAALSQHGYAGPVRTASGRLAVELHQQVEALTMGGTFPAHAGAHNLARESSATSQSSGEEEPSLLPTSNVESPRPWLWGLLFRGRPAAPASVALAARGHAHAGPGGLRRADSGSHGGARPARHVRIHAGTPDEEEGGAGGLGLGPGDNADAAAAAAGDAEPKPAAGPDPASAAPADDGADDGPELEPQRAAHAVAAKTFSALVRKYAALTEEEEAQQLKLASSFGKGLFDNCRRNPREHGLTLDNFVPFFPSRETAVRAFDFFDRNGDGYITKAEMKEAVAAIVAERRDMATSIRDTDSIVASLETFLAGTIHLLFIAFYLLVWDINVMSGFSTFSATVLALTFVFGDSVKNVFQSSMWLYINHPLDVGDTITLPPDETWYRVKKFGLVDTLLIKDNGDLLSMPNAKLWSSPLVNLTRSGKRTEFTRLVVDCDAPPRAREALNLALSEHCAGAGRGDFSAEPRVRYAGFTPEGRVRLAVSWTYAYGATDQRYAGARDAVMAALKEALVAVGGGALHTMQIRQVPHGKKD